MSEQPDLDLTIHVGSASRRIPAAALAAILRVRWRALRAALEGLAAPPAVPREGEPTEGECPIVSINPESETNESFHPGGGTEEGQAVWVARLVAALGDDANAGAIRRLATEHARPVLEEALRRTEVAAAGGLVRNRGAYFTAVVRALAGSSPCPTDGTDTTRYA